MPLAIAPDPLLLAAAFCGGLALAPLIDRAAIRLSDLDARRRDAPRILLGVLRRHPSDRAATRPAGLALRLGLPLAFAALVLIEHSASGAEIAARLYLVALLSLLALADHEEGLLPDAATLGGIALGLLVAWLGLGWVSGGEALLGAGFCWTTFRLLALGAAWRAGEDRLGLGDVKLAGLLGAWWGLDVGMLAFACGAVAALLAALLGREPLDTERHFGPWAILGLPIAIALRPVLDTLMEA